MREAASRGARLVVFPELALTTFFPRYWLEDGEALDRFYEREMPGPETRVLFERARDLGIGFTLGFAELTPQGERFNTQILVDAQGRIVGRYRKIHLPGHADHKPAAPFQHLEKRYFQVGNEGFRAWTALDARIGMCICNDRRWPETFRVLGLQSAEIVTLGFSTPSVNIHWPEPPHLRMFHHLLTLQSGAYQNALWVAAAAKAGFEDGFHMIGGSVIVSPSGEIMAQSQSEDDEVIFVNADLAVGDRFRKHVFNFAAHRRPEHYGLMLERTGAGAPLGDAS
jgi:predicted amidohydrolase